MFSKKFAVLKNEKEEKEEEEEFFVKEADVSASKGRKTEVDKFGNIVRRK